MKQKTNRLLKGWKDKRMGIYDGEIIRLNEQRTAVLEVKAHCALLEEHNVAISDGLNTLASNAIDNLNITNALDLSERLKTLNVVNTDTISELRAACDVLAATLQSKIDDYEFYERAHQAEQGRSG